IKYWGARNLKRAIPSNPSISMTLESSISRSTVELVDGAGEHEIRWRVPGGGLETAPPAFAERVVRHLDLLRRWARYRGHFRFATENSFPTSAGLASSASGFAALTLAALGALGRRLSDAEASSLARLSGSGSAARSVIGGFVEWPVGRSDAECCARQLAPAEHWDLRNVIALVETGPKAISSLEGHQRSRTSPYFRTHQRRLPRRLETVREAIAERDLTRLGPVLEAEAIDLHCVAMTSEPAIFYWRPGTLLVLEAVRQLRRHGLEAWATMDAGANVHVICSPEAQEPVAERLARLDAVKGVLRDRVGNGPVVEDEHLF
ncbi:MAG: diphosphomevalonate decarboxylase, partial [bacterium]|nr:diphosphomevalonate decarboxylase [bacterium]